ncbi:MAG: glycosyltransferase involved in cell wall biosynthesis, partial [Hyphomicrobiaceae bacterium]
GQLGNGPTSPQSASPNTLTTPVDVLAVSHSADLEGAERSLLTAVNGLASRGKLRPSVALPTRGLLSSALETRSIPCSFPGPYAPWLSRSAGEAFTKRVPRMVLNRALAMRHAHRGRARPPAMVWVNTLANPFGALLGHRLGVPVVWHVRELVTEQKGQHWDCGQSSSMRLLARSAFVVFTTQAVASAYRPFIGDTPNAVIPNGFDFAAPSSVPVQPPQPNAERPLRLLCVAKLAPLKGISDALHALAQLRREGVHAELRVAGTVTDYAPTLYALANELGISEFVDWHGYRSDVYQLYQWADLTLVCSLGEAFGRVTVESLAAGVPVVGTNSGATPEVLGPFAVDLLYPSGDTQALAARIRSLIAQPNLYLRIATQGSSYARETFGVAQYVSQLEQTLLATLDPHTPTHKVRP